jgi:CubicO group peptidase (beta-lactamase class C family)
MFIVMRRRDVMRGRARPAQGVRTRIACRSLVALACGFGASLAAAHASAATPAAERLAREIAAETPGLMQRYGVPGVAVAIIDPDGDIQVLNFGVRDVGKPAPVDDRTAFQVGSVSKFVTALGVMRMVDAGAIGFDMPISQYLRRWSLPEGAFATDAITVRRLLSHTAGLSVSGYFPGVVYPGQAPSIVESVRGVKSPGEAVRIVSRPGSVYAYSGGGYSVLQIALEDLAGAPFDQVMNRWLFAPLGLQRTTFATDAPTAAGLARPHDPGGGVMPLRVLPNGAAAGLSTTAREMAIMVRAILQADRPGLLTPTAAALIATPMAPAQEGLARPAMSQVMLAPETFPDPSAVRYGPGAAIAVRKDGRRIVGHSGSNAGWKANVQYAPEAGYGIVVLTNGESGNGVIMPLVCRWRLMLDGAPAGTGVCPEHAAARVSAVYAQKGAAAAATELRLVARAPAGVWFVTDRTAEDVISTLRDFGDLEGRGRAALAEDAAVLARANAELFPASALALASLANAEAGLGRADAAQKALEAALALDPTDTETRRIIASARGSIARMNRVGVSR